MKQINIPRSIFVLACCILFEFHVFIHAQNSTIDNRSKSTHHPESLIEEKISFSDPEKLTSVPLSAMQLGLTVPLVDGSFLALVADPRAYSKDAAQYSFSSVNPTLWRVKSNQDFNSFSNSYPGYSKILISSRFAASDNEVVLQFDAITNDENLNQPDTPLHHYLAFYEFGGKLKHVTPLNTDLPIAGLGLFPNGEVLVATENPQGGGVQRKHLLIFNDHGELQRELFQNDSEYDSSKSTNLLDGFILSITSYRNHLLLEFHNGNRVILQEINQAGELYIYNLNIPEASSPLFLIPSNDAYWYVLTKKLMGNNDSVTLADAIYTYSKADSQLVAKITAADNTNLFTLVTIIDGDFLANDFDAKGNPFLLHGHIAK